MLFFKKQQRRIDYDRKTPLGITPMIKSSKVALSMLLLKVEVR
ncbi:hypothetical protein PV783_16985 [Chitinophaga sp. CC14]